MALAYTPETGSGLVPDARGYASLAAIRAYNAQRGIVLPAADDDLIPLAMLAFDFIERYEPRMKGKRALPLLQPNSYPRACVTIYGYVVPVDAIPQRLIDAHCYATGVALTVDLAPVVEGRAITKEVIGPLETDYSIAAGASSTPLLPQLESIMQGLLNTSAGILRSVRV